MERETVPHKVAEFKGGVPQVTGYTQLACFLVTARVKCNDLAMITLAISNRISNRRVNKELV